MPSFMELIYIDSDDQACQTGLATQLANDAETWAQFQHFRRYGVDIKQAKFLLDYHKANGDLADTIALDAGGFVAITGRQPKSEDAYRKIDEDYWAAVRKVA